MTSLNDIRPTATTHPTPEPPTSDRGRVVGWLLAAWSFSFACVHFAWALGWEGGLPGGTPPIADRPWFLAYDVAAGLLMVVAAPVAVAIGRGRAGRWLRRTTLVVAVLALLRGAPALAIDVATSEYSGVSFGSDVWFVLAGLGGLILLRLTRVPVR
ncbi:hypothetical protein FB381_0231 [Nocardioides albertanoniae]|uniref:DUF3995 domain-containing protein n=1 Tax=Nocardioides albertanoniae TaxID=1175486 RepID=A0A543A1B3_9ACTN|nr:hypothetical protein [Nocardioides albertanoniae]TQL66377.1 hypothetical protein FB381_0231 [Nocardioides albertanoniae]